MSTQTVVIKYGGHAMDKDELNAAFADDMAFLQQSMRLVVVHGGGPQINALLNRLAIESRFEKGLRVTDADTMQAVEMVLCGQVNKTVVSRFLQHGARAAGLSGRDAGLLRARVKDPVLGLVGDVEKVDASVLSCLLDGGFLPVVAPVASGPEGQALNINADTAAGAVAGALHADYFVLISDVPGVLDADKKQIPALDRARIAELNEAGLINGGMIPTAHPRLHTLRRHDPQGAVLSACPGRRLLPGSDPGWPPALQPAPLSAGRRTAGHGGHGLVLRKKGCREGRPFPALPVLAGTGAGIPPGRGRPGAAMCTVTY